MRENPTHWQKVPLSVLAQIADIGFRTLGLILVTRIIAPAEVSMLIVWGTLAAFGAVTMGLGGLSNAAIEIARRSEAQWSTFRRLAGLRLRIWILLVPLGIAIGVWNGDSLVLPILFGLILLVGGAGIFSAGAQGVLGLGGGLDSLALVVRESIYKATASGLCLILLCSLLVFPDLLPAEWIPLFPLLGGLFFSILAWPTVRRRLRGHEPSVDSRTLLAGAAPLWLYTFLGLVQAEIGILILDALIPASELGIYGIAARIGAILLLPASTLGRLLAPKVAAPASSEGERLARMRPSLLVALLILLPAGALLALGLSDYLLWPLGPDYARGSRYLRIFSFEVCTSALFFLPALWLAVNKISRWFNYGLLAGAGSSILLNLWWISMYGAVGAAYAHLVSLLICQLTHLTGFFVSVRRIRTSEARNASCR